MKRSLAFLAALLLAAAVDAQPMADGVWMIAQDVYGNRRCGRTA